MVIGTSAGGNEILVQLVKQFTEEINAAFFIVMHIGANEIDELLLGRLQQNTDLPCQLVKSALVIETGNIYLAPANSHMLVDQNRVFLTHGPPENLFRPSIDVLFRTAAASFDSRAIGIILTGLLNDGCAGMSAIQRSGGYCIVQDPKEAPFSDMPNAIINLIKPDFIISVNKMGKAIKSVISNQKKAKKDMRIPPDVALEAKLAQRAVSSMEELDELGKKSFFGCPDCGGSMWNISQGGLERYRCHIGHSYTEKELLISQTKALEDTFWVALRLMEEKMYLTKKMELNFQKKGHQRLADKYKERTGHLDKHMKRLRQLLNSFENNSVVEEEETQ